MLIWSEKPRRRGEIIPITDLTITIHVQLHHSSGEGTLWLQWLYNSWMHSYSAKWHGKILPDWACVLCFHKPLGIKEDGTKENDRVPGIRREDKNQNGTLWLTIDGKDMLGYCSACGWMGSGLLEEDLSEVLGSMTLGALRSVSLWIEHGLKIMKC